MAGAEAMDPASEVEGHDVGQMAPEDAGHRGVPYAFPRLASTPSGCR